MRNGLISTESHGTICAGFVSTFTPFIMFGDVALSTKLFFENIRKLADNPSEKQGQITAYTLAHISPYLARHLNKREPGSGDLFLEPPLESRAKESEDIPITVSEDECRITIGKYVLTGYALMSIVMSIAQDPVLEIRPGYMQNTLASMRNSRRKLFQVAV